MALSLDVEFYLGRSCQFFACVGVLAGFYWALKSFCSVCKFLRDYFLGPALGMSADVKKAGAWAVVTGCTDGIGKAYAQQLAGRGLNMVLISRTQSKLDVLAKELETKYRVLTRTIAVDFTKTDIYGKIANEIEGLEIGTLVNNVGMFYECSHPTYFLEDQKIHDMMNCNMTSTVLMTRICLPGMVERRRGYVINMSSAVVNSPAPLMTVYCATKIFVDYFSRGLQTEYKDMGIIVQSVQPWFVVSKMSGVKSPNALAPTPDNLVRSALGTVGITSSTNGFWIHQIQNLFMRLIPESLTFAFMRSIRKEKTAQKEKEKSQ